MNRPLKFASLFSGGGGADLGGIAAGLIHVWGVEYDSEIANVYRDNIGVCINEDILRVDPRSIAQHPELIPDWLHASPVCKQFSHANANAGEQQWDIECGRKVAEFIEVLKPKYFSLENVQAYRKAEAFKIIVDTLHREGYWTHWNVLNAADFGVPQNRKRLILRAIKNGFLPSLPAPVSHVGWHEAIADLVHDLPDSQLAEWQIKALPDEIRQTVLVDSQNTGRKATALNKEHPSFTVIAGVTRRPCSVPYAILIENT